MAGLQLKLFFNTNIAVDKYFVFDVLLTNDLFFGGCMIILAYVHSIALRGYFLQFMIGYSLSRAKDQPVTLRENPTK